MPIKCRCKTVARPITIKKLVYLRDAIANTQHVSVLETEAGEQFVDVKTVAGGLGGDMVLMGKHKNKHGCCTKMFILKVFQRKVDYVTEKDTIQLLNKFSNGSIRAYVPVLYAHGLITDPSNTFVVKPSYYVRTELVTPMVSLQQALTATCQKSPVDHPVYKRLNHKQWFNVMIQLFHLQSVLKTQLFNHCDLHGDNVLITVVPKKTQWRINFAHIGIQQKYRFTAADLMIKIIDFDTGKFVKRSGPRKKMIELCPKWKSSRSGVSKLVGKSNDLRRACGLSYRTDTVQGIPIGPQIDARFNPVDGDWYHFRHFMRALESIGLCPNLQRKQLRSAVRSFSAARMTKYLVKKGHTLQMLKTEYLSKKLRDIYFVMLQAFRLQPI
ncbi:hypothetical protein OAM67_01365 [bacterium]|nr:hypothetical protein [bacterium]